MNYHRVIHGSRVAVTSTASTKVKGLIEPTDSNSSLSMKSPQASMKTSFTTLPRLRKGLSFRTTSFCILSDSVSNKGFNYTNSKYKLKHENSGFNGNSNNNSAKCRSRSLSLSNAVSNDINHDTRHRLLSMPVLPISSYAVGGKLKVLLVEDSIAIQKVMRRWLESNGCIVTTAENGKVGLALLKEQSFDITFMDFLMVRLTY